MWEVLIKDYPTQQHRDAVQINCDTTSKKYTEMGDGNKERETELNGQSNWISNNTESHVDGDEKGDKNFISREQTREYETLGVFSYLLLVQFISKNEIKREMRRRR